MPNPIENEDLYNSIVLGGKVSPGKVTLSGHDRVTNWDVKDGQGQTGASTTLKNRPVAKFTASFFLADLEDFEAWPDFLEVVHKTISGPTPVAVDVYHPDLASNKIKSVCEANVKGTTHDGKGGQTVVVEFIEYQPPKPKGGSPSGSKTKDPKAPDPNAAALKELADLNNQFNKTPWG